jgi:phosphopantetheinyl transferase
VWVLKESLIKASGRGFELDLKAVNVALNPARVLGVPARMGCAADWRVEHWRPTSSHIAALAFRAADGLIPQVEHGHGLE